MQDVGCHFMNLWFAGQKDGNGHAARRSTMKPRDAAEALVSPCARLSLTARTEAARFVPG
jgi:hypothetical protein